MAGFLKGLEDAMIATGDFFGGVAEAATTNPILSAFGTSYGELYDKYLEPQSWKDEREEVMAYRERLHQRDVERFGPEMAAQSRGIESVASPVEHAIMLAPGLASLAKYGAKEVPKRLLRRRLVEDASGKPQPFYHGTHGVEGGYYDIKPMLNERELISQINRSAMVRDLPRGGYSVSVPKSFKPEPKLYMSTSPQTAERYATMLRPGDSRGTLSLEGSQLFKKYLAPRRGKTPGIRWDKTGGIRTEADELHAVVSDPKVLVSPWDIAPTPLPNMPPKAAPALIDSIIRDR